MKNNDTWMRSKVNIQSHLNKSVTHSDGFHLGVCVFASEQANVFLNNNRIRRSRLNAVVRRSANVYEHWTISPALCKQTHVNNVINRHLIFVKCLLGFEWKEQITNRGNKTNRPTDQTIEIFLLLFSNENISLFQMFFCWLVKVSERFYAVCQL